MQKRKQFRHISRLLFTASVAKTTRKIFNMPPPESRTVREHNGTVETSMRKNSFHAWQNIIRVRNKSSIATTFRDVDCEARLHKIPSYFFAILAAGFNHIGLKDCSLFQFSTWIFTCDLNRNVTQHILLCSINVIWNWNVCLNVYTCHTNSDESKLIVFKLLTIFLSGPICSMCF